MTVLGVLKSIWDGYSAADGAKELGGFAINVAGMQLAEATIEQDISAYARNKSEANTRAVKASIRQVRDYLKSITVEQPSLKDLFDSSTSAKYQVSIALANYAWQLTFNIDMAVAMGNLPPLDDTPWPSRRRGYVRQRENLYKMTLQFEGLVRRKKAELAAITAFEARLFALAFGEDLTDGDLRMIQRDMDEQKSDENAARRTLSMFTLLANGSRKSYERFGKIIEAGDRAHAKGK